MSTSRREFVSASTVGLAYLMMRNAAADDQPAKVPPPFRICFFTDAHLPFANTLARLTNDKYHHQERVRVAFDKANAFKPDAYVFGGDNIFAVDQRNDGGDKEDNARAQFDNWKAVVAEKVKIPHHSVIGNHDIWRAPTHGEDSKSLAIAAFGMPKRYYSWSMNGWKFIMLDVFGVSGAPVDKEQMEWLEKELPGDVPTCIVTHAPILSVTAQLVGGAIGNAKVLRELFYKNPNVQLALSGHNHMVDVCTIDRVTYICGGAVCGSWWEGDYQHFPPAFNIIELQPDGASQHQVVYYETPPKK